MMNGERRKAIEDYCKKWNEELRVADNATIGFFVTEDIARNSVHYYLYRIDMANKITHVRTFPTYVSAKCAFMLLTYVDDYTELPF